MKSMYLGGRIAGLRAALLGAALFMTGAAQADIAQSPLFLTTLLDPNIMYIFDDSGSMDREYIPDSISAPADSKPYTKSAYYNALYYNPKITYAAPPDHNGTSLGDAPFTEAWDDGYKGTVNTSTAFAHSGSTSDLSRDDSTDTTSTATLTVTKSYTGSSNSGFRAVQTPELDDVTGYSVASGTCTAANMRRNGTPSVFQIQTNNASCRSATFNITGTKTTTTTTYFPVKYYVYYADDWRSNTKPSGCTTVVAPARNTDNDCYNVVSVDGTSGPNGNNGSVVRVDERQNYANWYSYYRSRLMMGKGGTASAFADLDGGTRVGYGQLCDGCANTTVDGFSSKTLKRGVRAFSGSARQEFYSWLFGLDLATYTPTRRALNDAGQYFTYGNNATADPIGPYSSTPGVAGGHIYSCRKNFTVLMTDGYWNSSAASTTAATKDTDSTDGPKITKTGDALEYIARSPFEDGREGTLADVAMYYWKTDLAASLTNNVTPSVARPDVPADTDYTGYPGDEAFWQHMVTFGIGLGVPTTIVPKTAFNAITDTTAASISWPDPRAGESLDSSPPAARADDLLHAAVNGRGGFFNATDPEGFAAALTKSLGSIDGVDRLSSSSIAANSTRLDTGTLIFQAKFNSSDWSGRIQAFKPQSSPSASAAQQGQIDAKLPKWDTNTAGLIPASGSRNIFTASGTQGVTTTTGLDFVDTNWALLSGAQRSQLENGGGPDDGKARLNWLRGDQSKESTTGFRIRTIILGDIINSDPFFVGATENSGYKVLPGGEGSTYPTFLSTKVGSGGKSGRTNMLYVGANDGMLHGFNADSGAEVFGYVPLGVFSNLHKLTSRFYTHQYFVDGSPRAGDAYLDGAWKTVLVGSTGAGGKSVFALDVTDPSKVGKDSLLWEFSTSATDTHHLGTAMSTPVIARVKAGDKWVAIFGNGYEVGSGNVELLVVDLADGSLLGAIDTGESATGNGLASPVPVDIDGDRITDYVYAGDLKGNMWRFNFTGSTTTSWQAGKLFQAVDGSGAPQPITMRPDVGKHPTSGLMVYFGTGKYFETGDNAVGSNPPVQSFYGIRDQFASTAVTRASLVKQTIDSEGVAKLADKTTTSLRYRTVSNVDAGKVPAHGWYLNLIPPSAVAQGERAISTPVLRFGRIIFTTVIPSNDPCSFGGSGWLMELNAINGGQFDYAVLDANGDGRVDGNDYIEFTDGTRVPASGIGSDEMIKTPGIVGAGDVEYKYTSGSSGSIGVIREKGSGNSEPGKQSWRQLQ